MRIKFWIAGLISLLLFSEGLNAQGCSAYINQKDVRVNVPFSYSAVFNKNEINSFTPPNFQNFEVLGGPHQIGSVITSTNITTAGMFTIDRDITTTDRITIMYTLVAKTAGTFVIDPTIGNGKSGKLKTSVLYVKVLDKAGNN